MTGREFRAIRLRLGLSQTAMAKRLGIERTSIYRWEHDRLPVPVMAALAVRQVETEAENTRPNGRRRG